MVFNFDFAIATVCSCLLTLLERLLEAKPNPIDKPPKTPPTTPKGMPITAPKPVREVPNPLADRRTEINPPEREKTTGLGHRNFDKDFLAYKLNWIFKFDQEFNQQHKSQQILVEIPKTQKT